MESVSRAGTPPTSQPHPRSCNSLICRSFTHPRPGSARPSGGVLPLCRLVAGWTPAPGRHSPRRGVTPGIAGCDLPSRELRGLCYRNACSFPALFGPSICLDGRPVAAAATSQEGRSHPLRGVTPRPCQSLAGPRVPARRRAHPRRLGPMVGPLSATLPAGKGSAPGCRPGHRTGATGPWEAP